MELVENTAQIPALLTAVSPGQVLCPLQPLLPIISTVGGLGTIRGSPSTNILESYFEDSMKTKIFGRGRGWTTQYVLPNRDGCATPQAVCDGDPECLSPVHTGELSQDASDSWQNGPLGYRAPAPPAEPGLPLLAALMEARLVLPS